LVSADLSLHAPTGRYVALETPQMSETVEKNAVVNGAVGAEVMLAPTVPLRLGFYTDRSSRAGAVPASLSTLAPDYSVVTGSIGYETERTAIVGGTAYEFGDDTMGGLSLSRSEVRWWVAASYRM